jgi:hypothetical protein
MLPLIRKLGVARLAAKSGRRSGLLCGWDMGQIEKGQHLE